MSPAGAVKRGPWKQSPRLCGCHARLGGGAAIHPTPAMAASLRGCRAPRPVPLCWLQAVLGVKQRTVPSWVKPLNELPHLIRCSHHALKQTTCPKMLWKYSEEASATEPGKGESLYVDTSHNLSLEWDHTALCLITVSLGFNPGENILVYRSC